MTIEILRAILGWTAAINIGLLLWWFLVITVARDWVYRLHGKFFTISEEHFNVLHYTGMMLLKLGTLMFFIAPYFALCIVA